MRKRLDDSHENILKRVNNAIYTVSSYIKHFLALVILIAIVLSFWSLPHQFMMLLDVESESLISFLKYIINMIIALELMEVLQHQTLDTIVEILLIALTRELIIERLEPVGLLIGVIAIAVLFGIRKYLYVPQLDKIPETNTVRPVLSKPGTGKAQGTSSAEKEENKQ